MRLKLIAFVLILSFGAAGTFSFLGVGLLGHGVGHHWCLVSIAMGGECPPASDIVSFVMHHRVGLEYFVQALVSSGSIASIFSLLLLIFSFLTPRGKFRDTLSRLSLSYKGYLPAKELIFKPTGESLRWLALHYKRDPDAIVQGA